MSYCVKIKDIFVAISLILLVSRAPIALAGVPNVADPALCGNQGGTLTVQPGGAASPNLFTAYSNGTFGVAAMAIAGADNYPLGLYTGLANNNYKTAMPFTLGTAAYSYITDLFASYNRLCTA